MRPLYGVTLKLTSTIIFAVMVVLIKVVGDRVPPGETVFFRSFFALIPVLAAAAWQGQFVAAFRTSRPFGHVLRSSFGVGSMFLWFAAFPRMPLADAMAISYAAPLLTVVAASILLGERVRVFRWSAVAVGFIGVLVILSPHLGDLSRLMNDAAAAGAMMAFASAFFTALAGTQVRRLTASEGTLTIVVYFSLGCTLFSLISLPFGWVVPSALDCTLLVLAGIIGGIGQIMITTAYRYADASTIAPLEYVSILWAILAGWWLWGDLPGMSVVVGSAIVIAAGLVIVLRERRLGLARAAGGTAVETKV